MELATRADEKRRHGRGVKTLKRRGVIIKSCKDRKVKEQKPINRPGKASHDHRWIDDEIWRLTYTWHVIIDWLCVFVNSRLLFFPTKRAVRSSATRA